MTGIEIAVGYVFAWAVRKARRAAGRADAEVDRAVDAGMDHLHELVSARLGQDPALERVAEEAETGHAELTERTRRRLTDSLEDAAERDPEFAAALAAAVAELQRAQGTAGTAGTAVAGPGGTAVAGDATITATNGSVAALTTGSVSVRNAPGPHPNRD